MARQAGALRAERLLGHLDDDLLPFLDQLFDLRVGTLVPVAVTTAAISRGGTTEEAERSPWAFLFGCRLKRDALELRRMVQQAALRCRRRGTRLVLFGLEAVEFFGRRDYVET